MKRGLVAGAALLGIGFAAYGQFGIPSIVFDPSSYGQIIQDVRAAVQLLNLEQRIRQEAIMSYAMMTSPGGWKFLVANAARTAGSRLSTPSTGNDLAAVAQLAEGQQSALMAMRQIASDPRYQPSAQNAAAVSLLELQTVGTTRQMNQLQHHIDFEAQSSAYVAAANGGIGPQSAAISAWRLP